MKWLRRMTQLVHGHLNLNVQGCDDSFLWAFPAYVKQCTAGAPWAVRCTYSVVDAWTRMRQGEGVTGTLDSSESCSKSKPGKLTALDIPQALQHAYDYMTRSPGMRASEGIHQYKLQRPLPVLC